MEWTREMENFDKDMGIPEAEPGLMVDDIVNDDAKLEAKAKELTGFDLVIDKEWKHIPDAEIFLCPPIHAVLVTLQHNDGAVRVDGINNREQRAMTSPNSSHKFALLALKPGGGGGDGWWEIIL
ncbi:MAG: hypothetical protein M1829_000192 [Trizodia sp. TS-e1964]|nr:MAG: hypothetical protein M1829_000192 [Trizodia sp. TS-e1964]